MVDLSIGSEITDAPVFIDPKNRVTVPGFINVDYLVYPVVDQLADKMCAMAELHNGYPSSRTKDLVDVMLILTHETIDGAKMRRALVSEASNRSLRLDELNPPKHWNVTYSKLAKKTRLSDSLTDFSEACIVLGRFASRLIEPGMSGCWNPLDMQWVEDRA